MSKYHVNRQMILRPVKDIRSITKWTAIAIFVGVLSAAVATSFGVLLAKVASLNRAHPELLLLLPFGAVIIVPVYRYAMGRKDEGANNVIHTINDHELFPRRVAPIIYVTSLFSHLAGASVGREGAALQMGGATGVTVARWLNLDAEDAAVVVMCGMSAAFSCLLGTPLAAAVFSLEVASVGIINYGALAPCVLSACIGKLVSQAAGLAPETHMVTRIPPFNVRNALMIILLATVCGLVSMLLCEAFHKAGHFMTKGIKNDYLKAFVGGSLLLVLTFVFSRGEISYNGSGALLIDLCFVKQVPVYAFLLKIIFTAISVRAGYKGGEIVPTLCVGACVGSSLGPFLNLPVSLSAAAGMGAMFCGATNCPLATLLMCFELFGMGSAPYMVLAVAISYQVSGSFSLYTSQQIIHSKSLRK